MFATTVRPVSRRRTLPTPVAFTMRVDASIRDKALYVAEQNDESLAKAVRRFMIEYVAAYEAKNGPVPLPEQP
jgi:hypothetical protein